MATIGALKTHLHSLSPAYLDALRRQRDDDLIALQKAGPDECSITVLHAKPNLRATKQHTWRAELGWQTLDYAAGKWFRFAEYKVSSVRDLGAVIDRLRGDPTAMVVRGAPSQAARDQIAENPAAWMARKLSGSSTAGTLDECARRWLMVDVDKFPCARLELIDDPEAVVRYAISTMLPPAFHDVTAFFQFSSSAGFRDGVAGIHLWFWLDRPLDSLTIKRWLAVQTKATQQGACKVDCSVLSGNIPHFIANPLVTNGHDPLPRRTGFIEGEADAVCLRNVDVTPQRRTINAPWTGPDALKLQHSKLKSALKFVPNDDLEREDWIRIGHAIKAHLGEAGRDLWLEWSAFSTKAGKSGESDTAERKWDGFSPSRITGGTIFRLAQKAGWSWDDDEAAHGPPHYPRTRLGFDAATKRLKRIIAAWFNRLELYFDAQDWMVAEAERLIPERLPKATARALARLMQKYPGMDPTAADDLAAEQALANATIAARQQARRGAEARFGRRAVRGPMPRIQIKGAAGLGKTALAAAEYLRRPKLWSRHIHVFTLDLKLADAFACDVMDAAANMPPRADGVRPRAVVIQGRGREGMCHPDRQELVAKAVGRVDSVYGTCCRTPASSGMPESLCPFHGWCEAGGYLGQFTDKSPALRVFAHQSLGMLQPDGLRLPPADLVIVDERCTSALVKTTALDPAILVAHDSYTARIGQEHLIQEAMDVGRAVVTALSGGAPAVQALRDAGVQPHHLRCAAKAAADAADGARPAIFAGMASDTATKRLADHRPHHGKAVAGVLSQLARDLENGRTTSNGVEWDATAKAMTEDGTKVPHPLIMRLGRADAVRAPAGTALLILDADADLEINRQLFGPDLRNFQIDAVRQTYTIQVYDAALGTSSLAPDERLPNNQDKAVKLRDRFAKLVRRETAGREKVLILTTLDVRRALAGEQSAKVDPSIMWNGAELTHYGRHRGANDWSAFDTVILLGREQLPPLVAERLARAIFADAPDVTITPTGKYGFEARRHDLRHGTAALVMVQVHSDPRVQTVVEMGRERGMGQGADRLRPVRRPPARPVRVIVMSNLPVPGLVVDRLVSLEDLLEGGTRLERALATMPGGVLPLSPEWLHEHMRPLFPSVRTAEREAAKVNRHLAMNIYYCQVAVYSTDGQPRPSKALIRVGVSTPQAELEWVLGRPVAGFRLLPSPVATPVPSAPSQPAAEPPAARPEAPPEHPVFPQRTAISQAEEANHAAAPQSATEPSGVSAAMLKEGAVVFLNPGHAAAAYPALWSNREAAKKAFQRKQMGTFNKPSPSSDPEAGASRGVEGRSRQPPGFVECPHLLWGKHPQLRRLDYQIAGPRHRTAIVWFDPARVPDPEATLTTMLREIGKMVWCRIEPASPLPEPDPPPAAAAAPDPELVPEPPAEALHEPVAPLSDALGHHLHVPAYAAPRGHLVASCPHCRASHFHVALGHQPAPCREPVGRGYVLIDGGLMPTWAPGILPGGWPLTPDVALEAWD